MATTYQLRTFGDIVTAAREELGVQSTDTTAINRLKRDVNIVYDEVKGESSRWQWATGKTTVQLPAYINTGTAAVTNGSSQVVLTTVPGVSSREGWKFAVEGYSEIYEIESHDAGSATLYLKDEYTGATSATVSYIIWTDRIALPVDCAEAFEVRHDHYSNPLDIVGLQELRRTMGPIPRAEGKPTMVAHGELVAPSATTAIAGMPALVSRESEHMTKTLVFNGSIPSAIVAKVAAGEPVRWRIKRAGHPSYNGDIVIGSISTTLVANDTVIYTGRDSYTEDATADASLTVMALIQTVSYDKYRELIVWPSIVNSKISLHIDYTKEAPPLVEDSDEPLIPPADRIVLLYGTLARAWKKQRNENESAANSAFYREKLAKMQGKAAETLDKPRLAVSRSYLAAKRTGGRGVGGGFNPGAAVASNGAGAVVTGAPNTLAVFDERGLIGSGGTPASAIGYIGNLTSDAQAQLDVLAGAVGGAQPTNTLSLGDGATTLVATYPASVASNTISYSATRGMAIEAGIIVIVTNGSSVQLAQGPVPAIGITGLSFSAALNGSDVELSAALTSTGQGATLTLKESRLT